MLSGMNEINTVREVKAEVFIPLTQGQVAVVDFDDFESLREYSWFAHKRGKDGFGKFYAARKECGCTISMHRQLMKPGEGFEVDHINMNTLDNRRANLRVCTRSQNKANANKHKDNLSGFMGVTWNKTAKAWSARLGLNGKKVFLGYFNTPEEAANAYNKAKTQHFGEFARLAEVESADVTPRAPHHNTTGFPGVTWNKQMKKFRARIGVNYKRIFLGDFDTAEEAFEVVQAAKQQYSKAVPTE